MKQLSLNKRICRGISMLLCMAVLLAVNPITAFAYERIDTEKETSLTAYFVENGVGMQNVSFRLHRVAEVSDAAEFALTGDFSDAPVSLDAVESAGGWTDMAATLSAWTDANGISPAAEGNTDSNGSVTFSGLTPGLYLLCGDTTIVGDFSYTPAPTIVMLPTLAEDDTWDYAPVVELKYTKTFLTEYQDVTVKKVWKDGESATRPDSVEILLLRDGQAVESVTLDESNRWTYTWNNLTASYEGDGGMAKTYTYTVSEKNVPTGYTVSVGQNGDTFTVTNTSLADPGDKTGTSDSTLPKTGTLNWPIPVLTIAGLLLAVLGWYLCNRRRTD